tara:strand:- start:86 stop:415 length:330 start_codon:yes stop_codon:yes gene_type:complete
MLDAFGRRRTNEGGRHPKAEDSLGRERLLITRSIVGRHGLSQRRRLSEQQKDHLSGGGSGAPAAAPHTAGARLGRRKRGGRARVKATYRVGEDDQMPGLGQTTRYQDDI